MFVSWLNSGHGNTFISVNEHIHNVYAALLNEGVDVKIVLITSTKSDESDEIPVTIDEVDDENRALTYNLNVNLANSYISMKKFNQLIEGWGIQNLN